jgi:hypothetical protein
LAVEFWKRGKIFEEDISPAHRYVKQSALFGGNGFPPRVNTAGIWLPVRLERRGPTDLADAWITVSSMAGDHSKAELILHVAAFTEGPKTIRAELIDANGEVAAMLDASVEFVNSQASVCCTLDRPALWWPNGEGNQHLYTLRVCADGGPAIERRVGVRLARWVRTPSTDKTLTLEVNGRRIYAGGASWAGGDRTLRIDEEAYRWKLTLLRDAHTTFMRVWGGLPREPRFFYDLCDELGILITQDFQLSNYSNNAATLKWIDPEIYARQVRQALLDLRRHACIVGWIAGNELRADEITDSPLTPVLDRAERLVKELEPDPTRLWLRSSYQLDRGWTDEYDHYGRRQSQTEEVEGILDGEPRFPIEYYPGGQHALVVHDLRQVAKYLPESVKVWPPPSLVHLRRINGSPWDQCFLSGTLPIDVHPVTAAPYSSWQDLSYWTQAFACSNIEAILGNWRGRWPEHAGSNLWHSHDQLPMLSWGLLDFYGAPKALYFGMKRGLAPVRAVMKYTRPDRDIRERLRGWVRVINMTCQPLEGYRVDVRFYDADLLEVIHIGPAGCGPHGRFMTVRPTLAPESDGSVLDRIHAGSAGQAHHGGLPDGCFVVPRAHTGGAPVAPSSCQEVLELNGLGYLFPYYQLTGLPDTSMDAEWGQPPARTPFGVVVTLTGAAGDVLSQCFYAYNFPWHHDAHLRTMTQTSIRARFGKWLDARRGTVVVSNEGPRLCPWVDVTSPDLAPDAFALDDNFFSLRAGETRTIGFTLRGGGGSGEPRFSARGMNIET